MTAASENILFIKFLWRLLESLFKITLSFKQKLYFTLDSTWFLYLGVSPKI